VALLDQLEVQQREVSGDGYPCGLQLKLSCLATAMHRGEPAAMLDIDPVLAQLREAITEPDFTRSLVKRLLLDNSHRVTITLTPDPELNQKMIEQEAAKLAAIKASLSAQDQQTVIKTSAALQQRQASEDDPGVLPKVGLDDVPAMAAPPSLEQSDVNAQPVAFYPQGTNGLSYQQVICALPELQQDQLPLLSLHNRLLTEVGIGQHDYLQTQSWQTRVCGGINAYSSMRGKLDDEQSISGYFTLSAKGLAARADAIDELMASTLQQPRFDEQQRIAELIARYTARTEQSVTGSGHGLAMSAACQGMSPIAHYSHSNGGLLGIQRLKALNKSLSNADAQAQLSEQLQALHQALCANPRQFLAVGEAGQQSAITAALQQHWPTSTNGDNSALKLAGIRQTARELWVCNSQVNFCAKAYPTVPAGHADAAPLTVLAGLMRNGFLHTAVREQGGAYGGGASQDSMNAAFRFYSYRDPRLCGTLDDFDQSIAWVLETRHEWRAIEEAILGVVSSLDKPSSPAGTAKQHYHDNLFGRTPQQQQRFRQAVLDVQAGDLLRVADTYLRDREASIGIVTHSGEAAQYTELCERENIRIHTL
ncbi:MAG: peptidase M16, partial [Gammaproteobacteria bacterium]|nr:peptidase M16 [Gammaproteobacteria bacterium]